MHGPVLYGTEIAPRHPNPANAAARWIRLAAQRFLPLDRSGPVATRSLPSRVPALSRPTPGPSVARPPGSDRQWAANGRARFVQGNRDRVPPARSLMACFPHAPRAGSVARALDGEPLGLRHGTESIHCVRVRFPTQRRQCPWSGTASRRILAGERTAPRAVARAQGCVAAPAVHGSIT
jgi:hypothetical protein